MSRQLKWNEWIEFFQIYEMLNLENVWIKYANYKKISNSNKWISLRKGMMKKQYKALRIDAGRVNYHQEK